MGGTQHVVGAGVQSPNDLVLVAVATSELWDAQPMRIGDAPVVAPTTGAEQCPQRSGFERDPVRYGAVNWRVLLTGESERFSPESAHMRPIVALAPFSPQTLREPPRS